jgi:hypothetical protein
MGLPTHDRRYVVPITEDCIRLSSMTEDCILGRKLCKPCHGRFFGAIWKIVLNMFRPYNELWQWPCQERLCFPYHGGLCCPATEDYATPVMKDFFFLPRKFVHLQWHYVAPTMEKVLPWQIVLPLVIASVLTQVGKAVLTLVGKTVLTLVGKTVLPLVVKTVLTLVEKTVLPRNRKTKMPIIAKTVLPLVGKLGCPWREDCVAPGSKDCVAPGREDSVAPW